MLRSIIKAVLVSRPVFWLIAPAAYLFGAYQAGVDFGPLLIIQALLLTIPLGMYVFGINDLFDIESDRANPRRRGQVWGARIEEGDRGWIYTSSLIVVVALLLSAASSGMIEHIITVALFLPFPFIYSAPPLHLKSRPVIDSLCNAAYTFGPFAMGYSLSGSFGFLNLEMVLLALVFSAAHAIGTVMDLEGDRKAGIRTFASALGPRNAALFALLLLVPNLATTYLGMWSFFLVIAAYFLASLAVMVKPEPYIAKRAFEVMNISLFLWMAYVALGALTGGYAAI